jgi:TolB-like protein/Flp pilus assembly protein TadD
MGLVSELRRRNVLRMAVLYAVAAWLIMQVAEVMMSLVGFPAWAGRATFAVLAVGFPIALIFSWFYELTPEGISLEKDVDRSESITHVTGRRLDFIVISLLCAAVILFAYDKWWMGGPPEHSIAVLPFENMSGDPEQQYFVSGMQDALIAGLSRISALKVTSKTSTMRYKDTVLAIPRIAAQLGVAKLIEGSIYRVDDRVRITVQLIDARADEHIWSETFEKEVKDVMMLQNEVAQAIARRVEVTLSPGEQAQLKSAKSVNPAAYEAFLKGQFHVERFTPQDMMLAAQYYQQAVDIDPEYALAHYGLSRSCAFQAQLDLIMPEEARERCLALVEKALELDDSLPEAHMGYAAHMNWLQFNWDAADVAFRRAIELNPSYAEARMFYSLYLTLMGRAEEGTEQMRLALELDPLNPFVHSMHGTQLLMIDDLHGAIKVIEDVMASTPGFGLGYTTTRIAYHVLGEKDKAIAAAANEFRITRGDETGALALEEAYINGDYTGAVLHAAEVLVDRSKTAHVGPMDIGMLYEQAGQVEKAIDWFEIAYREHDSFTPVMGVMTKSPAVHANPRFIKLLRDMKLDYWADKYSQPE